MYYIAILLHCNSITLQFYYIAILFRIYYTICTFCCPPHIRFMGRFHKNTTCDIKSYFTYIDVLKRQNVDRIQNLTFLIQKHFQITIQYKL